MFRSASLTSLALLLLAPPAPGRAAGPDVPKEPGVYWEQQVEMQMAGFSMPAQTSKVCLPKKGMQEPPSSARDDQKCKMTDVKRSGGRMTWKMKCDDGSTGEGDITSRPDGYDGTMTMRTQGNEVHMKMKGKKVGGDCDANEMKRKVATMVKDADDRRAEMERAQARRCDDAADEMKLEMFASPFPGIPVACRDTTKLCANLDTREGLASLRQNGGKGAREKVEKLCKKDLGPVIAKHCAAAAKEQEKKLGGGSTEFVFAYCPDVANALAKKECAGRRFTALPPAQRDFCTRWAQSRLEGGEDDEGTVPAKGSKKRSSKRSVDAPNDEETGQAKDDMKSKIFKGIFGR